MIEKIDHIGIAVRSIEKASELFSNLLGLKVTGEERVEGQKVKVAFLPLGDSELELLESTEPEGPIARFIEKKGEGIQHIAFRVDNIEKTLEKLEERLIGLNLLDVEEASKVADLIIKIKTIKYMDLQTDILEASRRVSRN